MSRRKTRESRDDYVWLPVVFPLSGDPATLPRAVIYVKRESIVGYVLAPVRSVFSRTPVWSIWLMVKTMTNRCTPYQLGGQYQTAEQARAYAQKFVTRGVEVPLSRFALQEVESSEGYAKFAPEAIDGVLIGRTADGEQEMSFLGLGSHLTIRLKGRARQLTEDAIAFAMTLMSETTTETTTNQEVKTNEDDDA